MANKIAPWVLERTANGQEAEFLVVLGEQADLSGADALKTKAEKGRFVRDALWKKAQETQGPLLELARGAEDRASRVLHRQSRLGEGELRCRVGACRAWLMLPGSKATRRSRISPNPLPVEETKRRCRNRMRRLRSNGA